MDLLAVLDRVRTGEALEESRSSGRGRRPLPFPWEQIPTGLLGDVGRPLMSI